MTEKAGFRTVDIKAESHTVVKQIALDEGVKMYEVIDNALRNTYGKYFFTKPI